jgi:hypothetical protein
VLARRPDRAESGHVHRPRVQAVDGSEVPDEVLRYLTLLLGIADPREPGVARNPVQEDRLALRMDRVDGRHRDPRPAQGLQDLRLGRQPVERAALRQRVRAVPQEQFAHCGAGFGDVDEPALP